MNESSFFDHSTMHQYTRHMLRDAPIGVIQAPIHKLTPCNERHKLIR